MMRELTAVYALCWRDLVRFSRDRSQVAGAIARPAVWLLFMGMGLRTFGRVGGLDYLEYVFPGVVVMTLLFGGIWQSVTTIWDREFGFLREVLVAPISRVSIVLGKTLSGAAVALLQGVVTMLFAPLIGLELSPASAAALFGAMALTSFGVTGLGFAIASRMATFEGFGIISNFIILPLFFLSGGVFPIAGLPVWLGALVHLNPMTYSVDLMRVALGQPHAFPLGLDLAVCAAFAAATLGLSLALFRRE